MQDHITLNYNWLKLQDYQFKVIVLIKMLATDKEQRTYTGTLKDIRQWLRIGNSATNNEKITQAIEELKNNNIIDYIKTGNTYTITIIDKPKNDIYSIDRKVDKQDIETIRKYVIDNNKRILANMLKIFIFALGNNEVITYSSLGLLLNIITIEDVDSRGQLKTNKVSNAIKTLEQCSFKDNTYFSRKRRYFIDTSGTCKGLGSEISVNKQFK